MRVVNKEIRISYIRIVLSEYNIEGTFISFFFYPFLISFIIW